MTLFESQFEFKASWLLLFSTLIFNLLLGFLCTDPKPIQSSENGNYLFDVSSMKPDGVVNSTYIDTIHVSSKKQTDEIISLILLDSSNHDMKLIDSIFLWTPQIGDTGLHTIHIGIQIENNVVDSISWRIKIKGFWPKNCPPYTHKDDVTIGDPATLPDGYFVYNINTTPGLYKSYIRKFEQYPIPNTQMDQPVSPSISDDGRWVCYVDQSRARICIVDINGYNKTVVPISPVLPGFPTLAGFYRQSPYGTEIFYTAGHAFLRSIRVDLSGEEPVFSNDRLIVNLGGTVQFDPDFFLQLAVVKDQVFGTFGPILGSKFVRRTAYLTIPDEGRGTGGPEDIYKWLNDKLLPTGGCGHTQSHDGTLCLENPGIDVGSDYCTPNVGHHGFYISNFRRVTDPPVDLFTEHVDKYAVSINWCPLQYRPYNQWAADFWGWYFGNRNDYVIGRQMGNLNHSGAWMVDWQKSIWYRLTPVEKNIQVVQPAVFFFEDTSFSIHTNQSEVDTTEKPIPYNPETDFYNPQYKIIYPNGGEVFTAGSQCTVSVRAVKDANANINISYDQGISWDQLPGLNYSINPVIDSLIIFTIPDSIFDGETMVPTASTECLIQIIDYGNRLYRDRSDGTFTIKPRK